MRKSFSSMFRRASRDIMIMLNESHGGSWLWVDRLIAKKGDYLLFKDSREYRGFKGGGERYSDAIVSHINHPDCIDGDVENSKTID